MERWKEEEGVKEGRERENRYGKVERLKEEKGIKNRLERVD